MISTIVVELFLFSLSLSHSFASSGHERKSLGAGKPIIPFVTSPGVVCDHAGPDRASTPYNYLSTYLTLPYLPFFFFLPLPL
ncbi:hypothetical protein DFP73DRAFT_536451 [Morchella snyderi]|nr:hypothetical protein DFP73DRAFT_536451 [Morchella snyderi]